MLVVCDRLPADDWPQYLGPQRDGVWREKGVSLELDKEPPKLLWSTPIGGGYSGPSVVGGRVFAMDWKADPGKEPKKIEPGTNPNFVRDRIAGVERVLCLNEKDGAILWEKGYPATYSSAFIYAIGPRATPLVHEDVVYTFGAEGHLQARRTGNGELVWSKNLIEEYKFEVPEWGTAAHPLVHEDLLICTVGGDGTTVVAFDKKTGAEEWRALSSRQPGYGTPVIETINGKSQLLVWHGEAVNSLDPTTGEVNWSVPFKPEFGMAIAAPRVWKGLVYVMGFNGKSGAIRVAADSRSAELIWGPDLREGVAGVFNTPWTRDGLVWSGGRRGLFRCVELETGKRLWDAPEPLLKADGTGRGGWQSAFTVHHEPSDRTLIFNDHGELIVSRLSREAYKEEGRMVIIEPTHRVGGRLLVWSHPALANGKIFCRNDKEIRCWDLRVSR